MLKDSPGLPHPGHPTSGRIYLSEAAGVFLGLGGSPEQTGGHWGRPQLQRATEVRGVGRRATSGGRGWWVMLLALGGQAELLGSPGEEEAGVTPSLSPCVCPHQAAPLSDCISHTGNRSEKTARNPYGCNT